MSQNVARGATEDELDQARVTIGPHDQQVGVLLVRERLDRLARAIDEGDDSAFWLYPVMPQVLRDARQLPLGILGIVGRRADMKQPNSLGSNEKRHGLRNGTG